MPEDDKRYEGKKVINVLVTTNRGMVTKVQRQYYDGTWYWGRINGGMKAWMPLPEPYREQVGEKVKLTIDIPREYKRDFIANKFKDFFSRVIADIDYSGLCGNYEKEIAEMFLEAFDKAIVGEINPNANVIPVANISFDKEDMQKMIQDELKKFQVENGLIEVK